MERNLELGRLLKELRNDVQKGLVIEGFMGSQRYKNRKVQYEDLYYRLYDNGLLAYFRDGGTTKVLGGLMLAAGAVLINDARNGNGFKIVALSETLHCRCTTLRELEEWVCRIAAVDGVLLDKEIYEYLNGESKSLVQMRLKTEEEERYSRLVKAGFLKKRGAFNRAYKKRFFRLLSHELRYYKKGGGVEEEEEEEGGGVQREPKGIIHLDGSRLVTDEKENEHLGFKIVCATRVYQLKASSEAEYKAWISSLSLCPLLKGVEYLLLAEEKKKKEKATLIEISVDLFKNAILKSGFLLKRGVVNTAYKRRYCELKVHQIAYFDERSGPSEGDTERRADKQPIIRTPTENGDSLPDATSPTPRKRARGVISLVGAILVVGALTADNEQCSRARRTSKNSYGTNVEEEEEEEEEEKKKRTERDGSGMIAETAQNSSALFSFRIVTATRTFILKAENNSEFQEWIVALSSSLHLRILRIAGEGKLGIKVKPRSSSAWSSTL
eukprot:jgi/Bigna1/67948/fgenesh1_pg.5_\